MACASASVRRWGGVRLGKQGQFSLSPIASTCEKQQRALVYQCLAPLIQITGAVQDRIYARGFPDKACFAFCKR